MMLPRSCKKSWKSFSTVMSTKARLSIHGILALAGLAALAVVALLNGHQFANFWHLFKQLKWYVLAAIVLVQVGSYWMNALYYRSILRIFSYDVGLARLFEGALATNFVNYVVPTAGLAGAGYLSQVLSPDVPRGEVVLAQLMRYGLSALAVLVMMPVGILLIIFSGDAGHAIVKTTILAALGVTILGVGIVALVQRETACRRTIAWAAKHLHRMLPKFEPAVVRHFIDEFYVGYHALARRKRRLLTPFGWSMLYIIIEILTFYMAFLAFGKVINPGIAVMAYLFANIASIFGGVFFSTGIFEAGMAGTLVALGLPFSLALSVTVVYRVLNLLIGLPPGFYFYRKYLP